MENHTSFSWKETNKIPPENKQSILHVFICHSELLTNLSSIQAVKTKITEKYQINSSCTNTEHRHVYIYSYILSISFFLQIQELGLQYQYNHDRGTYHYLRKFMALPFLPEDKIQPIFEQLRVQATTDLLKQLVKYVQKPGSRAPPGLPLPGACI